MKDIKSILEARKNVALRNLWLAYSKIERFTPGELSDEDVDIFYAVSKHSAIQDALGGSSLQVPESGINEVSE